MSLSASPPPSPLHARFPPSPPRSMPLRVADVASLFVKMRGIQQDRLHVDSCSGAPLTHLALAGDRALSARKVPLVQEDTFECRDAVDAARLLRASRASLLETAQVLGANVLVDEQWTCSISGSRSRSDSSFRVHIRYTASAARSERRDPQRPVALERARGVPGLMTIVSRQE